MPDHNSSQEKFEINRSHHFIRLINFETQHEGKATSASFMLKDKDEGCLSGYFKERWGNIHIEELLQKIKDTANRDFRPSYKLAVVSLENFMQRVDANLLTDIVKLEHTPDGNNISHMCIHISDPKYKHQIATILAGCVIATYDVP